MPRLSAGRTRERLQAAGARLTVSQVYDLTLAETDDPKAAGRAASDYWNALLERGDKPE